MLSVVGPAMEERDRLPLCVFQAAGARSDRSSRRRARLNHVRKPDIRGCDVGIAVTPTCAWLRQDVFVAGATRLMRGISQTVCEHDVLKNEICGTYRGRRAYEVYWHRTDDPVVLAFGREREPAGESR